MRPIPRQVDPERLDSLPADDPAAIHSRRDLQRLNVIMGNAGSIAGRVGAHTPARGMRRIIDLGGGDGTLLLRVARRLAARCRSVQAMVVDRHALVGTGTQEAFERLGWGIETATADVLEWLTGTSFQEGTVMIANLFLHHFRDASLYALLERISATTDLFVACEPRRTRFNLGAVRLVGLIGCSSLTREDGIISVRAGFDRHEISRLWPTGEAWHIEDGPTGPFSHAFVARRQAG
jgi:hypothetical protein